MLKRIGLFVVVAFVVSSNPQTYLSLSTQGINGGIIKGRFDYGIGIDFRGTSYNNHTETHYQSIPGYDTVLISDNKMTEFLVGPEISIGYYFSDSKIRPLVQAFSEALFPVYSTYSVDKGSGGSYKDILISGGLIGGIEYFFADKISIGSGIGPYGYYSTSENNYSSNGISSNSQSKNKSIMINLGFYSNFHFRYYF